MKVENHYEDPDRPWEIGDQPPSLGKPTHPTNPPNGIQLAVRNKIEDALRTPAEKSAGTNGIHRSIAKPEHIV